MKPEDLLRDQQKEKIIMVMYRSIVAGSRSILITAEKIELPVEDISRRDFTDSEIDEMWAEAWKRRRENFGGQPIDLTHYNTEIKEASIKIKVINAGGEEKYFIESILSELEGKEYINNESKNQLYLINIPTNDTYQLITSKPSIMVDKNLADTPLSFLNKNIKNINYVTFKSGDIRTEIGSKYGAWNSKDERVFIGIVCNCKYSGEYIFNGKSYFISFFYTNDALHDLNLSSSGASQNSFNESCKIIGNTSITHSQFKTKDKNEKVDDYHFFRGHKADLISKNNIKKGCHLYIWEDRFYQNYVARELIYFNYDKYNSLPDDFTRVLYIKLKKRLGKQPFTWEGIDKFLDRINLNDPNRSRAIEKLKCHLDFLRECGDIGKWTIRNNILTVYNVESTVTLRNRILEWLYREVFNNSKDKMQSPKEKISIVIDNLIRDYGPEKNSEVFEKASNQSSGNRPARYWRMVEEMKQDCRKISESAYIEILNRKFHEKMRKLSYKKSLNNPTKKTSILPGESEDIIKS